MLGNTPSAFNQVWHMPTDKHALTGKEFIEIAAKAYGIKPGYMVLKKWMLQIFGLFNPIIKEAVEMIYQSEYEYLFDSSKFEKAFGYKPTAYEVGIKATASSYKK